MNRIDRCLEALRDRRAALVPYVVAGDPDPEVTVALLHGLTEAGADLIELGIPFSDPMADGPVIQAACERALARGTDVAAVFEMVAEFRRRDPHTPLVLMGYMNPIERFGPERFLDGAARAGADGLLIVDLPVEESSDFNRRARTRGLAQIFLIAPTTTERRVRRICELAAGFVYYVSLKGITGAGNLQVGGLGAALAPIRRHTTLPVGVGFGIKTAADAVEVARGADAVVIGSALVERIAAAGPAEAVAAAGAFVAPIRQALDAAATEQRQGVLT